MAMTIPAPTPKSLIGVSVLLLMLAAVFALLNSAKITTLRSEASTAASARDAAEQRRLAQERDIKAREQTLSGATAKAAESESRIASAESEVVRMQTEKTELQAKVAANEAEIRSLQQQIADASGKTTDANPGAVSAIELQAQLDDARRQLEAAEREKQLLADKMRSSEGPTTSVQQERRSREATFDRAGVRGTVLAVNQAYNFVVLNLGGRNGVEPNSEMLVIRGGTSIGKIRISSVEPATAIGDIITSSLARGVQVQPGDIVIYAGSNS